MASQSLAASYRSGTLSSQSITPSLLLERQRQEASSNELVRQINIRCGIWSSSLVLFGGEDVEKRFHDDKFDAVTRLTSSTSRQTRSTSTCLKWWSPKCGSFVQETRPKQVWVCVFLPRWWIFIRTFFVRTRNMNSIFWWQILLLQRTRIHSRISKNFWARAKWPSKNAWVLHFTFMSMIFLRVIYMILKLHDSWIHLHPFYVISWSFMCLCLHMHGSSASHTYDCRMATRKLFPWFGPTKTMLKNASRKSSCPLLM